MKRMLGSMPARKTASGQILPYARSLTTCSFQGSRHHLLLTPVLLVKKVESNQAVRHLPDNRLARCALFWGCSLSHWASLRWVSKQGRTHGCTSHDTDAKLQTWKFDRSGSEGPALSPDGGGGSCSKGHHECGCCRAWHGWVAACDASGSAPWMTSSRRSMWKQLPLSGSQQRRLPGLSGRPRLHDFPQLAAHHTVHCNCSA